MLLVDRAHQSRSWWQNLINEDEDSLLWRKLDPLANHIDKLANGEISWDQILLLVDSRNVRLLDFLTDDLICSTLVGRPSKSNKGKR